MCADITDIRNRKQQEEKYTHKLDDEIKYRIPLWKRIFCCFGWCPIGERLKFLKKHTEVSPHPEQKSPHNTFDIEIQRADIIINSMRENNSPSGGRKDNQHPKDAPLELALPIYNSNASGGLTNNYSASGGLTNNKPIDLKVTITEPETKVKPDVDVNEIEKLKQNLRTISCLQQGQKLRVSYYGVLIIDLSYIPSLTRMLTGNNKNNTVEKVDQIVTDALKYKYLEDVNALINDQLKIGLINLRDTYRGSSVEEKITNLINNI